MAEIINLNRARKARQKSAAKAVAETNRVLHGRTAYTAGARHLQGCYVDKDSLHSRIRVLEAAR